MSPGTTIAAPARPTSRRFRTPTLIQMEAVECGAAAMGIIFGYYGRHVTLEQLRVDCGVSRDGSKAINMVRAARNYGLIAKAYSKEVEGLYDIRLPAILHWNFNHFVVLEGFGPKQVYLNDPASGPRTISYEELDRSFTGVVLTFEPGPEFRPGGRRPSLVRLLRSKLLGSETAVLLVALAAVSLVLPGIVVPAFSRIFVDEFLAANHTDWLKPLLLAMCVTAAARALFTWLQQRYILRLETKLAITGSSSFFWHVLRLPMEFFSQRSAGQVGWRVALADRVASLLSGDLATAAFSMINVFFFGVVMFAYDVTLTVTALATALLNFAALLYLSRRRVDLNQRLNQEDSKLVGCSMTGLQIIESLKASGRESEFFGTWGGMQAKVVQARQQLKIYEHSLGFTPFILSALNTAVILGLGGMKVMSGQLSMGTLVAFQSLMASFLQPIGDFVQLGTKLQDAQADLTQINDVFNYETDPQVPDHISPSLLGPVTVQEPSDLAPGPPKLAGYLELRSVTFGYSRLEAPLLENFSLRLVPGSRVALVGASGSGKSTVAKLVCGLYQPWTGEILFDGKTRDVIPHWQFVNSVAMVDQDIFLFEGTVRDNLTLWDSTLSEGSMLQAAKDACIHDVVAARPGGYASGVDEGGANYSGGQRQRLEIARALVTNPSILVLDEATSALDPWTENQIDSSLRFRGCTCLIIAHRLSTIRDCDDIIMLERGKVVQRGSHDDMMKIDGPYRRLILAE